ncbi:hypothetical protein C1I98_08060 [Spongiactinospora gelatinilytica]|uniref:Cytochrome P450 n=1 Tax=Spongiactinospora gelatinilytica TaxID=2666298 RepID=A0A2W2IQ94_9ACTN|nr:P450-derived glycosyltransferase activator [Spongiactinospora gelatinilytica]PZG51944.1 hypothetical protein C1I98_08060 [Spongiactinospora gelatinilytica]
MNSQDTTLQLPPLERALADLTDTELGLHLMSTRAMQWFLGSNGSDAYAMVLRGQTDDPYPLYERLRALGPLHASAAGSQVTCDPVVAARVLDGADFGPVGPAGKPVPPQVVPYFGRVPGRADKELWLPRFGAEACAAHDDLMAGVYRAALDRAPRPGFDLMNDVLRPATAEITAKLIGVPEGEYDRFAELCLRLARIPDSLLAAQRLDVVRDLDAAFAGLDALLGEVAGGAAPAEREALRAIWLLLSAEGVDAAARLAGNAALALLDDHDQWRALRERPELAAAAVEESLRHDPPVQLQARVARQDVELAGQSIPAGTHVVVVVAALGRDPQTYPEPARFDLTRGVVAPAGGGLNEFVAPLAKRQAEVALRVLAESGPDIRRDGPVLRGRRTPVTRGPLTLAVTTL